MELVTKVSTERYNIIRNSRQVHGQKFNSSGGTRGKLFNKSFGCDACPWVGTSNCSFGFKLGERHANGICLDRSRFIKAIRDFYIEESGKNGISGQKLVLLTQLADDKLWSDRMMQDLVQNGREAAFDAGTVLNWRKYIADHLAAHLKHEEGSKIQVDSNPLDVLRSARVVEAVVVDESLLGDDVDKEE